MHKSTQAVPKKVGDAEPSNTEPCIIRRKEVGKKDINTIRVQAVHEHT